MRVATRNQARYYLLFDFQRNSLDRYLLPVEPSKRFALGRVILPVARALASTRTLTRTQSKDYSESILSKNPYRTTPE